MSIDSKHTAGDGKVVGIAYTLTNDEGEVLDESAPGDPLAYLHGSQNIVPGLERALAGKGVGAKIKVSVAPEDGYGEHDGNPPRAVPRDAFPPHMEVEEGMVFGAEDDDGNTIPVWIAAVEGNVVHVDTNHPLAGETLHFDVEVLSVRDATRDELAHGHPHGLDGHSGHHH